MMEVTRVVVVEPGWAAWFLLGFVSGIALALLAWILSIWREISR
jgi:hypothetical protein